MHVPSPTDPNAETAFKSRFAFPVFIGSGGETVPLLLTVVTFLASQETHLAYFLL